MTLSRIALPLALLLLIAAALGAGFGLRVASMDETDVIGRVADRYVDEAGQGAEPTDCVAWPGNDARTWLVVACAGDAVRREYRVNRLGIVRPVPPGGPAT